MSVASHSARMGLRARLLVLFLFPALGVLALGGTALARASRAAMEDELGRSLSAIAATVSAQLRAERLLALVPEDAQGEGSRTYRALMAELARARDASGLRRILVVNRARLALLDSSEAQPLGTEVPELLRDADEFARVLSGERAASQVLFEAADGRIFKTGYAPLAHEGKIIGAVAVEGSATFFVPLSRLYDAIGLLVLATLVALALSAVISARLLSHPLERLVRSALRIGQGDLTTPVAPEPTREIGILARELEAMRTALERRDRQLTMMLGGVAHEVRNPLGGMELFCGLADEELGSATPSLSEARAHLGRVRAELDYLKRIVEDFLAFARERRLNLEPLEARTLVEEACVHLDGEAQGRGVAIERTAEETRLCGDPSLLTCALVNVVRNAVQASAPGTTVRVRGHLAGERYELDVVDAGPGIPAEVQARVFEPFFTTREKGTGLGLPLTRKLVEAHGGSVTLASRPGETRVSILLPLPE